MFLQIGYFTVVCLVAKPLIWSEAEGDLVVKGLATKHATVKWTIAKKPGESPVGVLPQNSDGHFGLSNHPENLSQAPTVYEVRKFARISLM